MSREYVNIYIDGSSTVHTTKEDADYQASMNSAWSGRHRKLLFSGENIKKEEG